MLLLTLLLLLVSETSSSVVHPTSRGQRNRKRILRNASTRHLQADIDSDLLEELYQSIAETYLPVWFDRTTGYDGQTYREALEFCEANVGDGYGLCPYEAVCPGGAGTIPLGGYRHDNYNNLNVDDGFGSWVPISSENGNEWVQVAESTKGYEVCTTWGEMAGNSNGPLWGLTGENSEEFTRSVMCCFLKNGNPDDNSIMTEETQQDEMGEGEDEGDESPTAVWYTRDEGYDGQTHMEASQFCQSIDGPEEGKSSHYELCTYDAVCPSGPNNEPFGGYQSQNGNEMGTYVPVKDGDNMWVQTAEGEDACVLWGAGGSSSGPLWGLTGEGSEEFTRSVLCCFAEDGDEEILQEEGDGGGTGEDDAVNMEESDSMPSATTTTTTKTTTTTTTAATTTMSTDGESGVVDDPLLPELGYVTQTWQVPQGYPEGIAYDKTNRRILLSSLVSGTIVALDVDDDMSRQNVYVPNTVTPGSGLGLKVHDRGDDEGPLVYATLTNFEAMDQGGLAIYELDMTDDTIAFMNNAVDTSPYYMSCLDGDTMCGMANDVVVTEEGVAYVTDSRNGRVFVVEDGVMKLVSDDPLLQTKGASFPYGANGLVYDERGFLVVGNTQMASLARVDLLTGEVASIPTTGEIGNVDGMLMHPDRRLLVITGTTIYILRDEENEWRSARVEGVVNVDYSDAGESATTATFGDDSNELYVTFVRFGDLFGGELSQEPALLARVLLEEITSDGNLEEAVDDSTVAPIDGTTTTSATAATKTPAASIAGTVGATISSGASSISAKSAKADGKSEKSSSENLLSKSSKTSTVDMIMPTHSTMPMMQEKYSKSGKGNYHYLMSVNESSNTKAGKAFTAKSGKAEYDVVAAETTTTITTPPVPELITAKSEKAFHFENSMTSKAAKTKSSKSSKAFAVGHVHDATTLTPPSNNEIYSKAAKIGAILEGKTGKHSSKAAGGGSPMGNFESMKSHELSGKSSKGVKMSKDSSYKFAKTSKYRLFKTELVRANSLFK